jgi:tetratricopeptide (TPR) repeat protein
MKNSHARKITPFWTRVPRFFLFPLQPLALWRVLVFAAIPALGAFATSPAAIAIAVGGLSLLAWIFLLRFGSLVLSETSLGHLSLSSYPQLPDDTLAYMPFKIIGLFVIPLFFVGLIASMFGNNMAMVANFAVTVITPAALMALVVSRSLATGLNPAAAWSIISGIGSPYVLLCVFLFFLSSGQLFLMGKIAEIKLLPLMESWAALEAQLQLAVQAQDGEAYIAAAGELRGLFRSMRPTLASVIWLASAVAMYFTLIAFNMLGYVLYQFHQPLALEVDDGPDQRGKEAESPAKAESEQIAGLIAQGDINAALEIAYEAQRLAPDDIPAQERYNRLLHLAGKDDRLLNHCNRLIPLLLRREQYPAALEAWQRCRDKHPAYRLEDAAQVLHLAELARAAPDPKLAMTMLDGFDKAFRNHPLVPDVYFLCARILSEDLRRDDIADRFLLTLCNRFPEHARVAEALRMREVIARLRPAGSPA